MKHGGTQLTEPCNKICADDRAKLKEEILELKYQNSRLRDDLRLAELRIKSSIVYHRLPHKKLVVMKEEQQKDREWDERMAREVLPATRLELK